jgi:hypothetical protein
VPADLPKPSGLEDGEPQEAVMAVTEVAQSRHIDPKASLALQVEVLQEWINKRPENSRIVVISPALANWILDNKNQQGNRKRKPQRIQRYAEAMTNDTWLLTGEPLIFGKTGKLLDGQNRLAAGVLSNKPFKTHVVFNIDDNVFVAINSGKSRSSSDTFYTAGIKDSGIVSPAVRWLMIYAAGDPTDRASYSNQEMWQHYQTDINKVDLEAAVDYAKLCNKAIPRGVLAAHFYMFGKKHMPTMKQIVADFEHNRGGAKTLTTRLNRMRRENQGRLHDVKINALLVQVWNAYRAKRKVASSDLKWDTSIDYPAIA